MAATLALGLTQTPVAQAAVMEDRVQVTIQHVDNLYDSNKWREALTYLEQHRDTADPELLWRLARLCYKVHCFAYTGWWWSAVATSIVH